MKMTEMELQSSSEDERDEDEEEVEEDQQEGDEAEDLDTDEELQEAFAAGLLKPGLNRIYEKSADKKYENDVQGMKQKIAELLGEMGTKVPWIEKLDLVSGQAPLAPELAIKEQQHAEKRENQIKNDLTSGKQKKKEKEKTKELVAKIDISDDPVHNDFKRELLFYRQAQSAVLEALPRLKSMNIPTKRPQDYFAQMAKTDEHMQKVRQKLVEKQMTEERLEKVRKLREMKKFGKKVQIEVQQKREKEKRDMLDQVKKFRKGKIDSLDFLDDDKDKKGGKKKQAGAAAGGGKFDKKGVSSRNKMKDDKFGFGGKKRGMKRNDKSSADDISGFRQARKQGGKFAGKSGKPGMKRPGKSKRQKSKGGKKH